MWAEGIAFRVWGKFRRGVLLRLPPSALEQEPLFTPTKPPILNTRKLKMHFLHKHSGADCALGVVWKLQDSDSIVERNPDLKRAIDLLARRPHLSCRCTCISER